MDKLEWTALEYEEKVRSRDWFWALGIIVVTSSIAAIIFGNYFFAILIVMSGVLLGFFAVKKPDTVHYELNPNGLMIRSRLYPYENMKSFWVQVDRTGETNLPAETGLKPLLFIKTDRPIMPIMSIPIHSDSAEEIRAILLSKNVIEEEMREHPSIHIMDRLGF